MDLRPFVRLVAGLAIVLVALTASCTTASPPSAKHEVTKTAVYLAPKSGAILGSSDLGSHPQVLVVHDRKSLEAAVTTRVAIWVDKKSVPEVDEQWLRQRDQDRCPVALIGINNALYAFREQLFMGIHGPYVDWSKQKLEPGFSVWMVKRSSPSGLSAYMSGFVETPTADAVLNVTDRLLRDETPPK